MGRAGRPRGARNFQRLNVKEHDFDGRPDGPPLWDNRPITVENLSRDGKTDPLLERLMALNGYLRISSGRGDDGTRAAMRRAANERAAARRERDVDAQFDDDFDLNEARGYSRRGNGST